MLEEDLRANLIIVLVFELLAVVILIIIHPFAYAKRKM